MAHRKETIGSCELWLGDCLEIMPGLAPVDHVIGDPPYEEVLHKAVGAIRRTDNVNMPETFGFDGIDEIRDDVARLCVEKSQGWVLLFCIAEGVRSWRDALQKYEAKYDTCCIWIKPDAMPRFNGQGPSRGFECIATAWAGKGYRSWNGGGRKGVFTHCRNREEINGHPTLKPLSLMAELVELFTQRDQVILDPFMGSGTTGVACAKLGRKFIGIEMQEKYFDIACDRIRKTYEQPDFFIAKPDKHKQENML